MNITYFNKYITPLYIKMVSMATEEIEANDIEKENTKISLLEEGRLDDWINSGD